MVARLEKATTTTRDVREYRWKGLCFADTPGIEADQGEEDSQSQ